MTESIATRSQQELEEVGARLAKLLSPGDIVYLEGELGVGKTTVSRGILRGLGYQGVAVSPTYTLLELYELAVHKVAHLDLYRISNAKELEGIGFRDYLDGQTICLIEWPENVSGFLPAPQLRLILQYVEAGRHLQIKPSNFGLD